MKAIGQGRYGLADVLELQEIDKPAIRDGEVRIRVRAASVNALDWHYMRGEPYFMRLIIGLRRPKPAIRGVDVAGTVEEVGKDVTRFKSGDEVFGWCKGAFAEYASAGEDHFVMKSESLTFEQAATLGVAAFTALQGVRDAGRVQPGQRILIIGASGGVGTFAVQVAKSYGAEVTGVCSTRNVELVRSIGADHVIDYTVEDVMDTGQRYDMIFQLAGATSASALRRVLTEKGTLVASSGVGGGRWFGPLGRIVKATTLSPFVSQRLTTLIAKENQQDLIVLRELVESGKVVPVMDRSYPLSEAPDAMRYLEAGHTQGKTVITM